MEVETGRVVVRELKEEDCEAASRFCARTMRWASEKYLKDVYPQEAVEYDIKAYSEAKLFERVKNPNMFALVAVVDSKICGIVTGTVHGEAGLARFNWIAVDPDHQHEGIGLRLLVAAEERLAKRGCHKICLYTVPALIPAMRLYMKFGLLPEAYIRKHWWGVDFLMMSKWIGTYKKHHR